MLVLRSVCRHFRAVTAELDFWYDADFLFADLVTSSYESSSFMRHYQEKRFLKVLFTDASLVNSLGRRKTDWKFESLEGLMAVMEGVPLFVQNARVIHLEILGRRRDAPFGFRTFITRYRYRHISSVLSYHDTEHTLG